MEFENPGIYQIKSQSELRMDSEGGILFLFN